MGIMLTGYVIFHADGRWCVSVSSTIIVRKLVPVRRAIFKAQNDRELEAESIGYRDSWAHDFEHFICSWSGAPNANYKPQFHYTIV